MTDFDWGNNDEDDEEYFNRQQYLFEKNPVVSNILDMLKQKIKNIRDWNRILKYPISIGYLGYPKYNELSCNVSFGKPINYNIGILIQFSPDIKRVFVRHENTLIEFDILNDLNNTVTKIVNFINTMIKQHIPK